MKTRGVVDQVGVGSGFWETTSPGATEIDESEVSPADGVGNIPDVMSLVRTESGLDGGSIVRRSKEDTSLGVSMLREPPETSVMK